MKKIIIALLILGTICANTFAQEYEVVEAGELDNFNNNEVYLTAGMPSFLGLFSGLFVALGEAGASDFAKTLGILQEGDTIKTNEKMETNVPGIYACGNAIGGLLQVCKAVYEGAEAGLSAVSYVRGNI